MFALRVVDGLSSGLEFGLRQGGSIVIGRDAGCDGIIEDGSASGRHFELKWTDAAGIQLHDLGSLNGVFVNGERVKQPRILKRGDYVQVGATLMELNVATQQALLEVRAADRAPAVKAGATMMMSASDLQDAIAKSRAEARMKAKEMGRTVVKTAMVGQAELAQMMAETPNQASRKTVVLQSLPAELMVQPNAAGVMVLQQLLMAVPPDSPAVVLVRKGAAMLPCAKTTVTFGRDARCDIPLASNDVSGVHTRIVKEPSGRFELVDEGSTNGSYVNGKRVVRQYLNSNDIIQIGGWTGPVVIAGGRLAVELVHEGVKVQDAGGIKVLKVADVGGSEWNPLLRERKQAIKVETKRDRGALLAKKKKGKSSDDIAWTATSDTERKVLKSRLAWAGLVISPIVCALALLLTRADMLAPGAVSSPHANDKFNKQAADLVAASGKSLSMGDKVSCAACHEGPQAVQVAKKTSTGLIELDAQGQPLHTTRYVSVTDAQCAKCHSQVPTEGHTKAGLTCFDCHGEHNGREFSPTSSSKLNCVGCHIGDPHETLLVRSANQQAKLRAPVIAGDRMKKTDKHEVHALHWNIEGRCLGCHAEGKQALPKDAWRTCGTCHAQAAPTSDSCTGCHNQHPSPTDALAYLGTPVSDADRSGARIDPGFAPVLVLLMLAMFIPLLIIAVIKPRVKIEQEDVVQEAAATPSAPAPAHVQPAQPMMPPPPPPQQVVAPPPPQQVVAQQVMAPQPIAPPPPPAPRPAPAPVAAMAAPAPRPPLPPPPPPGRAAPLPMRPSGRNMMPPPPPPPAPMHAAEPAAVKVGTRAAVPLPAPVAQAQAPAPAAAPAASGGDVYARYPQLPRPKAGAPALPPGIPPAPPLK